MKNSNNTLINYQSAINRFNLAIEQETPKTYFAKLTPSAQKILLASLKFNKYDHHYLELKNLIKKQAPVRNIKAFNLNEINQLRETVKTMSLKHQAVFLTMMNTGCRKFEVNEIFKNYCGEQTLLIVGKGNKPDKIFIDKELKQVLDLWIASDEFKLYSLKQLENIIKQVFEQAKIQGNSHDIRRTYGTNLRNHNMPLEMIKKLLRHNDINTTIKYIQITDNEILERLENRYLDVNEFVNENNYKEVVLNLIMKNQELAKRIKELENEKNWKETK